MISLLLEGTTLPCSHPSEGMSVGGLLAEGTPLPRTRLPSFAVARLGKRGGEEGAVVHPFRAHYYSYASVRSSAYNNTL